MWVVGMRPENLSEGKMGVKTQRQLLIKFIPQPFINEKRITFHYLVSLMLRNTPHRTSAG